MEKFKCIECGEAEVQHEDDVCEDCWENVHAEEDGDAGDAQ